MKTNCCANVYFVLLAVPSITWCMFWMSKIDVVSSFTSKSMIGYSRSSINNNNNNNVQQILLAKKKGFGTQKEPKKATTTKKKVEPSSTTAQPIANELSSTTESRSSNTDEPMNAGQKALAELRRQRAEQKDDELRRIREMLNTDKQVEETPAAIPEKVAQRMGQRMLPFVGLPLFLGMGTFVFFWYSATYRNMEFQPVLVAASTILILVFGLLGITYSVMSASWDADREGSFIGFEEFKRNINNIQEGLGRSRENAILRDKMKGLSEDELKQALENIERKEAAEAKRQQTLQSKLKDELD